MEPKSTQSYPKSLELIRSNAENAMNNATKLGPVVGVNYNSTPPRAPVGVMEVFFADVCPVPTG